MLECMIFVRCDETQESGVDAIFKAFGYSVGPDGCSLKAGFMVNAEALVPQATPAPNPGDDE